MDALKLENQARAVLEQHGDGAEDYVKHHLEAAEAAGLDSAARDWRGVRDALAHLRGELPA